MHEKEEVAFTKLLFFGFFTKILCRTVGLLFLTF